MQLNSEVSKHSQLFRHVSQPIQHQFNKCVHYIGILNKLDSPTRGSRHVYVLVIVNIFKKITIYRLVTKKFPLTLKMLMIEPLILFLSSFPKSTVHELMLIPIANWTLSQSLVSSCGGS